MDTVLSRIEDGPMYDEIKDQRTRIHGYYSGIRQFVELAEETTYIGLRERVDENR